MKYNVYIQGFDKDGDINDYTEELATFDTHEEAEHYVLNNKITFDHEKTTYADVIIEERYDDGRFNDLLYQHNLE